MARGCICPYAPPCIRAWPYKVPCFTLAPYAQILYQCRVCRIFSGIFHRSNREPNQKSVTKSTGILTTGFFTRFGRRRFPSYINLSFMNAWILFSLEAVFPDVACAGPVGWHVAWGGGQGLSDLLPGVVGHLVPEPAGAISCVFCLLSLLSFFSVVSVVFCLCYLCCLLSLLSVLSFVSVICVVFCLCYLCCLCCLLSLLSMLSLLSVLSDLWLYPYLGVVAKYLYYKTFLRSTLLT